ncbi:hypothetical protein [Dehalobacter restrictus]|nr:hypothetical protein [Dehalobacter restrictus]
MTISEQIKQLDKLFQEKTQILLAQMEQINQNLKTINNKEK